VRWRVPVIITITCTITCAGLAGAVVVGTAAAAGAQTVPPRVLVYGDSLAWEAQAGIEQAIEARLPGWDAIMRTAPGTAVCNGLPQMRADGNLNAQVVVLEYVAVALGPCMAGKDRLAQHTADTQAALALWASRGVRVVLVGAPRQVGQPRDLIDAVAINRDLAAGAGQTFVDAGVLLRDPWTGVYQQRLPCLAGEGPVQGCGLDGLIDVRDDSGSHFCAIHNAGPCPVYSSGIVRFAAPIADAVARVAGTPSAAPLPGPPTATDVQRSVRAVLGGLDEVAAPVSPTLPSAADREIATSALLTGDTVQPDFTALTPTTSPAAAMPGFEDRTCRTIRRALAPVQTGARAAASFTAPGASASIDQLVYVARTEKRARAAFAAYAAPDAATCLSVVLGVPVTADPATAVGDASMKYHIDGARDFVLEIVVAGRSLTSLAFSNAATPPSTDVVDAVTKTAVARADAALADAALTDAIQLNGSGR